MADSMNLIAEGAEGAQFAVDEQARTIKGVALVYGATAVNAGRRWEFQRGSVQVGERDLSRVKLHLDHNRSAPVGKLTKLEDTDTGLMATFQVARGPMGDEALFAAADGSRDGLSIGVSNLVFSSHPTKQGVKLVSSAALDEISLCSIPAFDDARVSGVSFSAETEGENMSDNTEALTAATEALTKAVETFSSVPAAAPVVTESVKVTERPVYAFNGTGPSIVLDAWRAHQGDQEASARIGKFNNSEGFSLGFANGGNTTDQANLIPPGYTPELYVGQPTVPTPLYDAVSHGSIPNATPFKIPLWVGSSGLIGVHTEGASDTPGTITNHGIMTVTPVVLSGKFVVNRELLDAANPAIDGIVTGAMNKAYLTARESRIATAIQAVTDDNTAGRSTEGAYVKETSGDALQFGYGIEDAMAAFQFGDSQLEADRLVLSKEGFGYLAAAVDSTGRKNYPYLGPSNAMGTVGKGVRAIEVAGLDARGSAALAGGTNDAYLFNSSAIWVWESSRLQFRFEEVQGPEKVVFAVWGYFAVAVVNPAAISAVDHTLS